MNNILTIALPLIALIIGAIIGILIAKTKKQLSIEEYKQKADKKIKEAEKTAEKIVNENKQTHKEELEEQTKQYKKRVKEKIERLEKIITFKEEQLKRKEELTIKEEQQIENIKKEVENIKKEKELKEQQLKEILFQKTGKDNEAIKKEVLDSNKADLELMKEERLNHYLENLEEEKKKIAKNMLTEVIQRYSSPTSVEKKDMTITVKRDEDKGKIIGQNAENLVYLEEITECNIIFNDTPKTIIVSSFDLYRKYIAFHLIKKLLQESNITKEKIKTFFDRVETDTKQNLVKSGKKILKKVNITRTYPDEFYQILGRLQFRTSYGQNILKHSYEVGYFTLMLGSELGLNEETCKIGGFLHDLGKSIDKEVGEPHDVLTKQIMEKYEFSPEEIHAAWTHHDAIPIETAEAMLVKAGDAISAGRPGARQETLEKYIARIKAIEEIGNSYEGIKKAYAISAGRELRVIVNPIVMKDKYLAELAETVAKEIEENVGYPGKIKINVIRKTKVTETAKSKS